VAFTKPTNSHGKEKKQQVNPALRLPAERWQQPYKEVQRYYIKIPQGSF
jgi:hypothetical protein